MTNIKQLVALNIKQYRLKCGLTQAKLAEKANASTQYIAMIELGRKFPSLEMLERLAAALEIDNLVLFSPPPFPSDNLINHQKTFLAELEKEIGTSVNKALQKAVKNVVNNYLITPGDWHRVCLILDSWRGLHTFCTLSRASLRGGYEVWNPRPIPYENNIPSYSTLNLTRNFSK
jgi:transcriptional regulator with XRE-family HTH domain